MPLIILVWLYCSTLKLWDYSKAKVQLTLTLVNHYVLKINKFVIELFRDMQSIVMS